MKFKPEKLAAKKKLGKKSFKPAAQQLKKVKLQGFLKPGAPKSVNENRKKIQDFLTASNGVTIDIIKNKKIQGSLKPKASKSVSFDITKNKKKIFAKNSLPLPKAAPTANVAKPSQKSILKKPKKEEPVESEDDEEEEEEEEEMMDEQEDDDEMMDDDDEEEEDEVEEGFDDENFGAKTSKGKENKPIQQDGKKRALEADGTSEQQPSKKPKVVKKELRAQRREKKEGQELIKLKKQVKKLWGELRDSKCEGPRKEEVLKLLLELTKDKLQLLIYKHDTSRVIECIVSKGSHQHRTQLFEELKGSLAQLCLVSYSKFFVLKLYKYGTKEQKELILQSLKGKMCKLMSHKVASSVVETIYNEFANARQRAFIMQEFYSPDYARNKDEAIKSLSDAIQKEPSKKEEILEFMKENLLTIINKEVTEPSLLHALLREFLLQASEQQREEVLQPLCTNQLAILPLVHTRDGARVAMMAAWHSPAKRRKVLVKSLRERVVSLALEEHGHMFLLALLDCVDDTTLLAKVILPELMTKATELAGNPQGRRVLVYLVAPRHSRYFHPDLVKVLAEGDGNQHTKKEPDTKRKELVAAASPLLAQFLAANLPLLRTDNAASLLLSTLLTHMAGDLEAVYRPLAKLVAEPGNLKLLENKASFMLVRSLLRNNNPDQAKCFGEILAEEASEAVMRSWIECNRGAFSLVNLLELGLPQVTAKVKKSLEGLNSTLGKLTFHGAKVLLSKLKSS